MIPAFINARAGTMQRTLDAVEQAGEFEVHQVDPNRLSDAVKTTIADNRVSRIAVAGGDGTICTAAGEIYRANPTVELAILPGGTLNHFAKDHGIAQDLSEAARRAIQGEVRSADVAFIGERLFLNTSSVGAYVTYVRMRDRLERYVGYRLASFGAALRILLEMRPVQVTLEVEGKRRQYDTPLVFIGVGERELRAPTLGARVPNGQHKLHVLVVRERRAARLMAVALAAVTRGLEYVAQTPQVDSFLVDRCSIGTVGRRRLPYIAVDGEIVQMQMPIDYRIERDALKIVV
jgi:diacylglycerol kinase family enzyme